MFEPIKLSLRIVPPGNPQIVAEWAAPDGKRLIGHGGDVEQAVSGLAKAAMLHHAGERIASDEVAMAYFHPEEGS